MKQRSVGMFLVRNKMKNKKYHTVDRRAPKSNIIIIERGKVDTPTTQIHNRAFSLLCTGTSIKGGGVKRVKWTQISTLRVMQVLSTCEKLPTLTYNRMNIVITMNANIVNIVIYIIFETLKFPLCIILVLLPMASISI